MHTSFSANAGLVAPNAPAQRLADPGSRRHVSRVRRRILCVWDADYPWDVRLEKICRTLSEAGHDVHIAARNRNAAPQLEQLAEGTVHRMPVWRRLRRLDRTLGFPAFFNPRWIGHLARTVEAVRPDVMIARDLPLCPTAIHLGRRFGVPVIHDMAEHYPAMIREIYRAGRQRPLDYVLRNPAAVAAVERYCIRNSDRILVVIDEMRSRLVSLGVPESRIDLVSNTPSVDRVGGAPSTPAADGVERPLRLVYLGIMEIPRGIGDLIRAAALRRQAHAPVQVDLIGTGRDAELFQQQARSLGVLGTDVRFHGYVASHEDALAIVAAADIGILPHRRCEHWDHTIPNKLFDYMAAGLPVLTSDARPFARIVHQTECGEVFASGDPAALAQAIGRLSSATRRHRYAVNGQRAIREHYNWEREAAVLIESIERAIYETGANQ
jgi:glycosyltransferase involved in cell wall biosynthesis